MLNKFNVFVEISTLHEKEKPSFANVAYKSDIHTQFYLNHLKSEKFSISHKTTIIMILLNLIAIIYMQFQTEVA